MRVFILSIFILLSSGVNAKGLYVQGTTEAKAGEISGTFNNRWNTDPTFHDGWIRVTQTNNALVGEDEGGIKFQAVDAIVGWNISCYISKSMNEELYLFAKRVLYGMKNGSYVRVNYAPFYLNRRNIGNVCISINFIKSSKFLN